LGASDQESKDKYRNPNQTRHIFATREIVKDTDPLWIAKQMGTSTEMLFRHYAVYFARRRGHTAKNLVDRKGKK